MKACVFVVALSMPLLGGAAAVSAHEGETLGGVHFPISCAPAVQADFERAVLLLHSFWYEEAVKAFTAITTNDPSCAMGYWGIAMSLYHPLWAPPDPATLQKGAAALGKTRGLTATPREKDYIAAIETYYRDSDKLDHRARALAYEKAMAQLHDRYPDDREAAVFYALALNGTALPTDKTYANQIKAAAILEKVHAEQPGHPGVAHYIIHSYDYPPLATRGLAAAREYAKIAPSVPHAQHMPAHIFTRLGLWQESIDSNLASANSGKAYYAQLGKDTVWDQTLHALDYLVYAYLQTGQDKRARAVLEGLGAAQKAEPESFVAAYAYAAIPARAAPLERGGRARPCLEIVPMGPLRLGGSDHGLRARGGVRPQRRRREGAGRGREARGVPHRAGRRQANLLGRAGGDPAAGSGGVGGARRGQERRSARAHARGGRPRGLDREASRDAGARGAGARAARRDAPRPEPAGAGARRVRGVGREGAEPVQRTLRRGPRGRAVGRHRKGQGALHAAGGALRPRRRRATRATPGQDSAREVTVGRGRAGAKPSTARRSVVGCAILGSCPATECPLLIVTAANASRM
jgi:hypothetical protein